MDTSNLVWVAGKVLNTGGHTFFQKMLERGELDAAESFLALVLRDRILTALSSDRLEFVEAAEYWNLLELSPALFPQQIRFIEPIGP